MNELAADGIAVTVTCRVLGIARQPYYRWLKKPVTDAELAEAYRANALFDAHREDPEFGYRYLADEAETAGETRLGSNCSDVDHIDALACGYGCSDSGFSALRGWCGGGR